MKLLTLWQPWATAIALGLKKYETRHWQTSYRGSLAIHAAKRKIDIQTIDFLKTEYPDHESLIEKAIASRGNIVAVCDLTNCLLMDENLISGQTRIEKVCGNWAVGRFAWELQNIEALLNPIPCRGTQSLRDVPEEIEAQIDGSWRSF